MICATCVPVQDCNMLSTSLFQKILRKFYSVSHKLLSLVSLVFTFKIKNYFFIYKFILWSPTLTQCLQYFARSLQYSQYLWNLFPTFLRVVLKNEHPFVISLQVLPMKQLDALTLHWQAVNQDHEILKRRRKKKRRVIHEKQWNICKIWQVDSDIYL